MAEKTYREKVEEKRQAMAETLIQYIESNPAAWERGWYTVPINAPMNGKTQKKYKGLNSFYLSVLSAMKGYTDPRWITFNQAKELGGHVKAGEKSAEVMYWSWYDKATKKPFENKTVEGMTQEERQKYLDENVRPVLKFYQVFNAQQCENLPVYEAAQTPEMAAEERARQNALIERVIENSAAPVNYDGGNRAYYSPSSDSIHLPEISAFKTMQDYYATALHEIAHSTGHESRLNRQLTEGMRSRSGYAKEELRAELASVFMQSELGISVEGSHFENHGAYLAGWLKAVKDDPKEFFAAVTDAEKISDYVAENYLKERTEEKVIESAADEERTQEKNNVVEAAEDAALRNATQQYRDYMSTQTAYPDATVVKRVGDFYEILGEPALQAADKLGLTLVNRDVGLKDPVPMVGFPYHNSAQYIEQIREYSAVVFEGENGNEYLRQSKPNGLRRLIKRQKSNQTLFEKTPTLSDWLNGPVEQRRYARKVLLGEQHAKEAEHTDAVLSKMREHYDLGTYEEAFSYLVSSGRVFIDHTKYEITEREQERLFIGDENFYSQYKDKTEMSFDEAEKLLKSMNVEQAQPARLVEQDEQDEQAELAEPARQAEQVGQVGQAETTYYYIWRVTNKTTDETSYHVDYYRQNEDGRVVRESQGYGQITPEDLKRVIRERQGNGHYEEIDRQRAAQFDDLIAEREEHERKAARSEELEKAQAEPWAMDGAEFYERLQELEADLAYGAIDEDEYNHQMDVLKAGTIIVNDERDEQDEQAAMQNVTPHKTVQQAQEEAKRLALKDNIAYVVVEWSESNSTALRDNTIMTFDEADKLLEAMNEVEKQGMGYYKTKLHIVTPVEGKTGTKAGWYNDCRYYIGSEPEGGLIAHIKASDGEEISAFADILDKHRFPKNEQAEQAELAEQVGQAEPLERIDSAKQWLSIELTSEQIGEEHGQSTMIKMPQGEYSSFVFFAPTKLIREDEKSGKVKLSVNTEFNYKLHHDGTQVELTGLELRDALAGKEVGKSAQRVSASYVNKQRLTALTENVPVEMKSIPNWCAYKTRWNDEKGKKDKFVLSPIDGKWAKSSDPATWTDFETAMEFAQKNNCEGLAFALDGKCGISCIDLDHSVGENGELTAPAQKLTDEISESYIETSVSGNGIHIFVKEDILGKGKFKNRTVTAEGEIEVYDSGRFISMTGNVRSKTTQLGKCPMATTQWLRSTLGEKVPERQVQPRERSGRIDTSDDAVIARIRNSKKGGEFDALYRGEDLTGDNSRNDFKMMNMLAFFTDCDKAQMERIFKGSGLYRPEKGQDYVIRSIDKACSTLTTRISDSSYSSGKSHAYGNFK